MNLGPIFRSLSRNPVAPLLIVLQIALTLAIVSNAIFIIDQRLSKMARSTGVAEDEIIYAEVEYFNAEVNKDQQARIDISAILDIPGVKSATYSSALPLGRSNNSTDLCYLPTNPGDEEQCPHSSSLFMADEKLIATLGLELIGGRNFRLEEIGAPLHRESPRAKVIIITQALAKNYYPAGDALGKNLLVRDEPHTIIGIIKQLQQPVSGANGPNANHSVLVPERRSEGYLVIRATPATIAQLSSTLEDELMALNDQRIVYELHTMIDIRNNAYQADTAMIYLLIAVIILLVLITSLGIAGLISFSVASRYKQIGTRRALGARKIDIVQYFLVENSLLCAAGLSLGCLLAIALNQYLMRNYQLSSITAGYIGLSLLTVLIISQCATLFPALRGAQVSPATATRTV